MPDKFKCLKEIIQKLLFLRNSGEASFIKLNEYAEILKKFGFVDIVDSLEYYNNLMLGTEPILRFTKLHSIIFMSGKILDAKEDNDSLIITTKSGRTFTFK